MARRGEELIRPEGRSGSGPRAIADSTSPFRGADALQAGGRDAEDAHPSGVPPGGGGGRRVEGGRGGDPDLAATVHQAQAADEVSSGAGAGAHDLQVNHDGCHDDRRRGGRERRPIDDDHKPLPPPPPPSPR